MQDKKDYNNLLLTIKQKVREAQIKTVISANSQMLWLYWQLGRFILQNQLIEGWGAKIIDSLSADLTKEFSEVKGFSKRNMLYMKQFSESYSSETIHTYNKIELSLKTSGVFTQPLVAQILSMNREKKVITQQEVAQSNKRDNRTIQQPVAQLEENEFLSSVIARISWSHHVVLMDKVTAPGERFWYMIQSIENGMSRNILRIQIESSLFERQITSKKVTNFTRTLPAPQSDFAEYILKDSYIFDFVQAKEKADERDIEKQLTGHITRFLLELGQGFAFIGRQVHFEVAAKDFYIDLLFYHTQLHAYVAVELKAREFEPGDAGQLNFYINLLNDKLKKPGDNDTIGLLLCKGKNEVLAEYALKGIHQPIGVSDYQLSKAVPEELKSRLPGVQDLENELLKD